MMKIHRIGLLISLLLFLGSSLSLHGCTPQGSDPEGLLQTTLAGLAGLEQLHFEGRSAVQSLDTGVYSAELHYTGELRSHTLLSMTVNKGRDKKRPRRFAQSGDPADGFQAKLEYKSGTWKALQEGYADSTWLSGYNPLQELSWIGSADKHVSEELGAARGTRVLRVELDPQAAYTRCRELLQQQMEQLKNELEEPAGELYTGDEAGRKKLLGIWEKERRMLEALLDQSTVNSVYYVTVRNSTGLPVKLLSERRVTYQDQAGRKHDEMLRSEVSFSFTAVR
ncbi:hypothetical protein E6C60_1623 [Paenibacillus algicola]|uniref:Lipoprotein n=1 Tax=Paenibacillus algicola TaxID=2565926 RepID=A0A4P8XPM9_9BACL|nr:hypothetical protein [Paenibacillus algicola]QCT02339.1 hypothetical protein E6C60_1623 [Paenibacillus algicola]